MVGLGEPREPLGRGGEQGAVPDLTGADAEPDRKVGLAGAGWSEEDHVVPGGVVPGGDEVQGAQVGDQITAPGRLRDRGVPRGAGGGALRSRH